MEPPKKDEQDYGKVFSEKWLEFTEALTRGDVYASANILSVLLPIAEAHRDKLETVKMSDVEAERPGTLKALGEFGARAQNLYEFVQLLTEDIKKWLKENTPPDPLKDPVGFKRFEVERLLKMYARLLEIRRKEYGDPKSAKVLIEFEAEYRAQLAEHGIRAENYDEAIRQYHEHFPPPREDRETPEEYAARKEAHLLLKATDQERRTALKIGTAWNAQQLVLNFLETTEMDILTGKDYLHLTDEQKQRRIAELHAIGKAMLYSERDEKKPEGRGPAVLGRTPQPADTDAGSEAGTSAEHHGVCPACGRPVD